MDCFLHDKARAIINILTDFPEVRKCTLYGSLSAETHDRFSDIDIEVDVSGYDNGLFMLGLAERLRTWLPVCYSDYAPSLVPDRYIVSIAIDEHNPFLVVDLCCTAAPHCATVTRQQVRERNDPFSHILKLWTANAKHYLRGAECHSDILRMARHISPRDHESSDDAKLLGETLIWLEQNTPDSLKTFVSSCRQVFNTLI